MIMTRSRGLEKTVQKLSSSINVKNTHVKRIAIEHELAIKLAEKTTLGQFSKRCYVRNRYYLKCFSIINFALSSRLEGK